MEFIVTNFPKWPAQLGKPRACVPSGTHGSTTWEYHHPAPAQLIIYSGQRLVVSVHSQSLQLTVQGKSLPFIYQQQPKLSYMRRVYSAHMRGSPQVPRMGDRGGCATGPYRTPITLSHTTKTQSQSSSTKYKETNTGRRQRNMAQMKGQIKTPEKELNNMEASNLSDAEFKTLVIRMLQET